jgi:hypothetical protein
MFDYRCIQEDLNGDKSRSSGQFDVKWHRLDDGKNLPHLVFPVG